MTLRFWPVKNEYIFYNHAVSQPTCMNPWMLPDQTPTFMLLEMIGSLGQSFWLSQLVYTLSKCCRRKGCIFSASQTILRARYNKYELAALELGFMLTSSGEAIDKCISDWGSDLLMRHVQLKICTWSKKVKNAIFPPASFFSMKLIQWLKNRVQLFSLAGQPT